MEYGSIADWFSGGASATAVIVALFLARKADKDAKMARLEMMKATGQRTLVKLLDVVNSIHGIHQHIETQCQKSLIGPDGPELWRSVQPLVGFADEGAVSFGGDEAALLIEANEVAFLMDLLLLGKRHAALISTMKEYTIRRDALCKLIPTPAKFEGLVGTSHIDLDGYMQLKPWALTLEALITQLRQNCATDWQLALAVSSKFGPIMRTFLKDSNFPILGPPVSGADGFGPEPLA